MPVLQIWNMNNNMGCVCTRVLAYRLVWEDMHAFISGCAPLVCVCVWLLTALPRGKNRSLIKTACACMFVCVYLYLVLHVGLPSDVPQETFNCTSPNNSCTVDINISNVAHPFCITVTAHSPRGDTRSDRRCQSGRKEGEGILLLHPSACFAFTFSFLTPSLAMSLCIFLSLSPSPQWSCPQWHWQV